MTETFEMGDYVTWSQMKGVAFYIRRPETERVYPDEGWVDDPEDFPEEGGYWYEPHEDDYAEIPTGNYVVTMVGDDREFIAEPDDLTPLEDDEFCSGCGQMGCGHG